jgi:type IV secretion system protein VirD4
MVMTMLEYAGASEENEQYISPLDLLFAALEAYKPNSIALRQYQVFKQAAGKTAKSILISCAVRLAAFNLEQIRTMTSDDELDITSLGERKTALFAIVPDNDTSFNFLVGMLYTQIFQALYYEADHKHKGILPVHVHFMLDEFANVALPEEFDKCLSTMRSRGISASIIIQNLAQLKSLFKGDISMWETISGNCDSLLYLGGNEQSTHEYISKLLGKATIDTRSYGHSKGRSGSYSTNKQITGRELLLPNEVREIDNEYSVLFIRGAKPIWDRKFKLESHSKNNQTSNGNSDSYIHIKHGFATKAFKDFDFENAGHYIILD